MPVEVMHAFNRKYNVTILEGYGLSETSPVASFNHLDREPKPGSIGIPIWGIEMRVVDSEGREVPNGELGEIVIRGHNVMKGYYKRPDATADAIRNGWFYSGDIAYRDDDGFFFIKDRVKDMIIRGGFNVYPREIEEVLYGHPAIAEAAVIGVPDPALGEEVKAVVAFKPGQTATEAEIIEYCKERLASYKYPRFVEIRDTLPKTATGKILKRELRQVDTGVSQMEATASA
jgi:long-chain acyl-CoA synthetase